MKDERDTALARLREAFPNDKGWKHSIQTVGGVSTVVVFCGPIQAGSSQLAGDRSELDLAEYLITAFDTAARKWLAQNLAQYEAAIRVLRKLRSATDGLMGDSDLDDDQSPAMLAMQAAAAVLSHPLAKEVQ